MKVIIAGSRTITDLNVVMDAIDASRFEFTEVFSGCAKDGVDSAVLMKPWACVINKRPAPWKRFGRSAGFLRNIEMARDADALIAVWDGVSRGAAHMITTMRKYGKPVELVMAAAA